MSDSITQNLVHALFTYNNNSTLIYNYNPSRCTVAGSTAGCLNKKLGYYVVKINNKSYRLHRVIYLYHKGYVPSIVDHINRIKTDNRIENLREVNASQSSHNVSVRKDSVTGIKGIGYHTLKGRWQANVTIKGKTYYKSIKASIDCSVTRTILEDWIIDIREKAGIS